MAYRWGFVFTVCAAALCWLLPAAAIDYTPHGTQPGLAWDIEPASSCEGCHKSFVESDAAFMPFSSWAGSMKANAGRDPLFWAALDVANRDLPGVGDYCLRCHSPTGWFGGRVSKTSIPGQTVNGENGCLLFGNHIQRDDDGNDYAGVNCHTCHRMMPKGPGGESTAIGSARLWLDDATTCTNADGNVYGGPCRRGPYRYGQDDPLEPPHGWVQSSFHAKAEICGNCHNVDAPETPAGPVKTLILNDGTNTGITFPVERTYSEWLGSDFADLIFRDRFGDGLPASPVLARGETCQDCHMRVSTSPDARACNFTPTGSRQNDMAVHEFVGANTWVPKLLKAKYGAPSQLNRESAFDRTIAWAVEMLTQRSAEVDVTLDPYSAGQATLTARVRVINLSGHKLPTGYAEGRRMWLNVVARDANNQIVFESGAYNASTAVLTEDGQARVYEALQGIWDSGSNTCKTADVQGRKLFHFVLNNCIAKDTRIPPLGFRGGADVSLRPVGLTYPQTAPGSGRLVNYDDASYAITVPPGTPLPITVRATLKHQIASRDYIEFLQREAVQGNFPAENTLCSGEPERPFAVGPQNQSRGQFLYDLWNDPVLGKSPPEDMRSDAASTGSR